MPPGTVHPRGWFEVRGSFRHPALPHPQRVRTPAAPTGLTELRDLFARRLQNYSIVKGLMPVARRPAGLARSGGYRDRTGDIQLAKLALSQLS